MDTLQEINDFILTAIKRFNCKVVTKSSAISENNGFVEIRIVVSGNTKLDCYECICAVLEKYFIGAIIRFPPIVYGDKNFQSNEACYLGS